MPILHACVHHIDTFTEHCGRLLAWLLLFMAILTTCVVVLRYGFSIGSIATQEAVTYMHGGAFLLGSAYALKKGAHVRVDISTAILGAPHPRLDKQPWWHRIFDATVRLHSVEQLRVCQ